MQATNVIKDKLIARFKLLPHPEGGFFRETYRSGTQVRRQGAEEMRSASTAIYFLLGDGAYSTWHRIDSDEVWHFYAGEPIDIHILNDAGQLMTHCLGNVLTTPDAVFQVVVPAGQWFAAECRDKSGFALAGCTVAPGFEFSKFELADIDVLQTEYPAHRDLIGRLR